MNKRAHRERRKFDAAEVDEVADLDELPCFLFTNVGQACWGVLAYISALMVRTHARVRLFSSSLIPTLSSTALRALTYTETLAPRRSV